MRALGLSPSSPSPLSASVPCSGVLRAVDVPTHAPGTSSKTSRAPRPPTRPARTVGVAAARALPDLRSRAVSLIVQVITTRHAAHYSPPNTHACGPSASFHLAAGRAPRAQDPPPHRAPAFSGVRGDSARDRQTDRPRLRRPRPSRTKVVARWLPGRRRVRARNAGRGRRDEEQTLLLLLLLPPVPALILAWSRLSGPCSKLFLLHQFLLSATLARAGLLSLLRPARPHLATSTWLFDALVHVTGKRCMRLEDGALGAVHEAGGSDASRPGLYDHRAS